MPINGPMIIWCEPVKRGDLRVAPGDIADAIAWFVKQEGKQPCRICLHPKNERFASEVPDGIEVRYINGCLRGEIWLSAPDILSRASEATESKIRRDKNESIPTIPVGRPKADLPMEKVQEFASRGLGCRAIANKLKEELGLKVSYRSIHRALKKPQLELPFEEAL